MEKHRVEVRWNEGLSFKTEINGHSLIMDADESIGGENKGMRPKPLLLASLAGCSGIDVVMILKKMRVDIEDFDIRLEGELTEEPPKYYKTIKIVYEFKGKNLPLDKLQKAVDLSMDKYCGVAAMLKSSTEITSEIIVI